MNTIEIVERNIKVDVPERYDEMTDDQVIYIMQRLAEHQAGQISIDEFRVRVLYKLCNIRRSVWDVIKSALNPEIKLKKAETVALLCDQLLDGILEKFDAGYQIKFDSVRNFWPSARVRWKKLVGPAEGLLDLSFAEFRAATDEMSLYLKTKDEVHLDRMLACLYRPIGPLQPSGRKVVAFDSSTLEKYTALCHQFQPWQKQLILLWLSSCVKYMQSGKFIIGSQEVSFAELFKSETSSDTSTPSLGWLTVLYDLAEKRTFGNLEQTDQQSMIDILSLLYHYKKRDDATSKPHR